MPKRNKPHARARDRAIRAVEMRLGGYTNAEIAGALKYSSESGARMAIDRELNRRAVAGVDTLRREHGERLLSLLRSCWGKATGGDTDAIRTAKQLLDSISKLWGLDAAMQIDVRAGVTEEEFATMAVELLKITGTKPLVELAAPVLSPDERAALYAEPQETYDPDWSNLGTQSPYRPAEPLLGANHLSRR